MGKMKDKMIDQMNQDWSAMHDRERAILDAERMINEEMLWRELQQEHLYYEQLEQAKIIKEQVYDNNEKVQGTTGNESGPECSSDSAILLRQDFNEGTGGQQDHTELHQDNAQERVDSRDGV